jgi:hypothetical protein
VNDAEGGPTPIIRSDIVYDWLEKTYPEFIKEIEEKGVLYYRTVPQEDDPSSVGGRSWKSMFHVDNREDAEKALTNLNYTWTWHENGDLTLVNKALPGVKICSNGRKAYFN